MMLDLLSTIFTPVTYVLHYVTEELAGDTTPLLPPLAPDVYGDNKRTVMIGLEGTLVWPIWTRKTGWVVRKRPGLDNFLRTLQVAGFEVVLFSSKSSLDMASLAQQIDVVGFKKKLFLHNCNFKNGLWVKDLTRLDRDLRNVIVIDADYETALSLQPENAIHLKTFTDDSKDRELARISKFLEQLNEYQPYDVRDSIKLYNADPDGDPFQREKAVMRKMHGGPEKKKKEASEGWVSYLGSFVKSK